MAGKGLTYTAMFSCVWYTMAASSPSRSTMPNVWKDMAAPARSPELVILFSLATLYKSPSSPGNFLTETSKALYALK